MFSQYPLNYFGETIKISNNTTFYANIKSLEIVERTLNNLIFTLFMTMTYKPQISYNFNISVKIIAHQL